MGNGITIKIRSIWVVNTESGKYTKKYNKSSPSFLNFFKIQLIGIKMWMRSGAKLGMENWSSMHIQWGSLNFVFFDGEWKQQETQMWGGAGSWAQGCRKLGRTQRWIRKPAA